MQVEVSILISKHGEVSLKLFKDPKAFMEYSSEMDGVYSSNEEHYPRKSQKFFEIFEKSLSSH